MIVAGIGSRKGVSVQEVLAAVETALEAHGLALSALSALATTEFKREEAGIFAAGEELGLPVMVVGMPQSDRTALPLTCLPASSPRERGEGSSHQRLASSAMLQDKPGHQGKPPSPRSRGEGPGRGMRGGATNAATLTHSALSQAVAGTPSVSEMAALAAAGQGARLAGPRIAVGRVTCAIAFGGDDQ